MNEGMPVNPGVENYKQNISPKENFGRIKTFVQKALDEGSLDKLFSRLSPRQIIDWEETVKMAKGYFFTDSTLNELEKQHGLTRQTIKLRIDKLVGDLRNVVSDELKMTLPPTEIPYRKPLSQRANERKSVTRGGTSIKIKNAITNLGIAEVTAEDIGRIAQAAGLTKRQVLRPGTKLFLKKTWGIDIPRLLTRHHKYPERKTETERLSDEEMGNLLSSVGNNEAKAITLVLMRNGNVFGEKGLHREILYAQGGNKTWNIGTSTAFHYLSRDFSSNGLVAMGINPDTSAYGYTITNKGKQLGIPLAGLLLDFSQRHNIPLRLLLGDTKSPSEKKTVQTEKGENIEFKKRAPLTTLKILYELLISPHLPIKETALGDRIGEIFPSALEGHLSRLSKLGVIEYKAVEANMPYSLYKLASKIPEGELPRHKYSQELTALIINVLKTNPSEYLTIENVYANLPQEQKEKWKEINLKDGISKILFFLAKHGYVTIEKFHFKKLSEIYLTDSQKVLLMEFLEIMNKFQKQDKKTLEKGIRLAERMIMDPQTVSSLMERARRTSSQANASPAEDTQKNILSIVFANPGITNKEIQILLRQNYGKELGIASISDLSFHLSSQGNIKAEKEGSVSRFYRTGAQYDNKSTKQLEEEAENQKLQEILDSFPAESLRGYISNHRKDKEKTFTSLSSILRKAGFHFRPNNIAIFAKKIKEKHLPMRELPHEATTKKNEKITVTYRVTFIKCAETIVQALENDPDLQKFKINPVELVCGTIDGKLPTTTDLLRNREKYGSNLAALAREAIGFAPNRNDPEKKLSAIMKGCPVPIFKTRDGYYYYPLEKAEEIRNFLKSKQSASQGETLQN